MFIPPTDVAHIQEPPVELLPHSDGKLHSSNITFIEHLNWVDSRLTYLAGLQPSGNKDVDARRCKMAEKLEAERVRLADVKRRRWEKEVITFLGSVNQSEFSPIRVSPSKYSGYWKQRSLIDDI